MDKSPQKITKNPKRQEAVPKDREKYMNKLKESILNDAEKGGKDVSNASNNTSDATTTALPPLLSVISLDLMMSISMVLVWLLC